ncbi:alkene reductase [Novosphingobium sp.]|uniref:alkene reductase n=1 Tax=Novosphingobium sp. TaxID=1874826 RepID=UPI0022CC82DE|nr:alkene reductase [Novosphingobium sp.]MCZ8018420.1 alkene reductase [Novosphingobium sp.]MCZ8033414.1 alkene reductase [Novosphingobium sp.]MCZ8051869.1 alkene reductase [Novosphingobium sp.]MCZ8060411.1 alkene reductase [Novosphingobium sp.]MCZ8232053.1 alkene reductase [Novosphingobium sp.]
MTASLFSPVTLGEIELSNRIVMAPMTRDRAGPGDVPTDLMVAYYAQRASAGLIVTEGVQPSPVGKGYWRTPGIHSAAQVEGWRKVADAVHARGGKIVMQLMHCGRVVVPANRGFDAEVIAPSAIPCPDKVPGPDGVPQDCAMPRAILAAEIPALVEEYAEAARNAVGAGIDGVELHCASGYLINQFLNPVSNQRDDDYGGSIENRIRFPIAVLQAMAGAIGPGRVGFRISPGNPYNGMDSADPAATFGPFVKAADGLGLAYLHVVDMGLAELDTLALLRANYSGPIVTNNNLKADSAAALLDAGRAEAVSFGRAFIANPDLVERIAAGAPLAKPDYARLYTGEELGYTDYPVWVG